MPSLLYMHQEEGSVVVGADTFILPAGITMTATSAESLELRNF